MFICDFTFLLAVEEKAREHVFSISKRRKKGCHSTPATPAGLLQKAPGLLWYNPQTWVFWAF